jgi:uncharacterized protein YndB with AHSA1/START domain
MTATTEKTTQIYRVYIKATPEAIWDAITKPEWTQRYGYGGGFDGELRAGDSYRVLTSDEMRAHGAPDVAIDGEVIEMSPPRRLVLTWRMVMDPDMAAEGYTRLTYEIEDSDGGSSKLTVIHDVEGAPRLAGLLAGEAEAEGAGGGWSWVLSDLKSLLETGSPVAG